MKKYTPHLFFISLVLTAASYFLISKGKPEIYPFYSWKLFSKPFGATKQDVVFKIYGVQNKDTLAITMKSASEVYDADIKFAIINRYGNNIANNTEKQENLKKLRLFADITAPGFDYYILVKETFNAQEIGKRNFSTTKTIITAF